MRLSSVRKEFQARFPAWKPFVEYHMNIQPNSFEICHLTKTHHSTQSHSTWTNHTCRELSICCKKKAVLLCSNPLFNYSYGTEMYIFIPLLTEYKRKKCQDGRGQEEHTGAHGHPTPTTRHSWGKAGSTHSRPRAEWCRPAGPLTACLHCLTRLLPPFQSPAWAGTAYGFITVGTGVTDKTSRLPHYLVGS